MTIKIKLDLERLEEQMTVGELLAMQSGNIEAVIGIMAKFVTNEAGEYLEPDEGRARILALSIKDMKSAAAEFSGKVTETVVPPTSGTA